MSAVDDTYDETLNSIVRYFESRANQDPYETLSLVNQELDSQNVRYGNDWTGRGVVMDAVITATIAALEIVRTRCLKDIEMSPIKQVEQENEH